MKKKWQAKNWQKLFFILVLLIFIFIILFRFAELKEITNLLKRAKPIWIAAAVCFQFAVFAFLACLYRCILKSGKRKGKRKAVSFFYLLKTVIAMYFIDHILPSFSASGNVLLYYSARKKKIKKDKASLLIGLNIFMNFLVYVILFIISLILLYSKIIQKIWILGFLIIIAFTMLYRIIWTASGQRHFKNFLSWLLHYWPKAKKNALKTISNFYKAKKSIKKQKFMLFLFYTILVYIFKIATIAAVFLSLNYIINPAVLITGYIITSAVALLSYVRIGVYEASMTLAYSMLGISYNLALTATLLYRGISFWLPMLLGFIFFRKLIQKNKATDKNIIKTAKSLIGKKYKYGASLNEAPELFDCSSFIQFIFKQAGINLPRSTIEQIEKGKTIELNKLMPGDLIFIKGSKFHTSKKWPEGVGHVALYIGNKQIIHAEGSRHKKVVLEKLNRLNLSKDNFRSVKRILK